MARKYATADVVSLPELLEFVRPRHRMVLTTFREDGSLQSSPVSGGVDDEGRIVIASYPQRAKSANIRRTPRASVTVLSDEFNDAYVQVDGDAEVIDLPDAVEPLVDYYRSIAGEHPDWAEYRQAMVDQGKCLIRVTPRRWGPVATGGFPPQQGYQAPSRSSVSAPAGSARNFPVPATFANPSVPDATRSSAAATPSRYSPS
jgi:PPOX class probable F420-dependent enzyme